MVRNVLRLVVLTGVFLTVSAAPPALPRTDCDNGLVGDAGSILPSFGFDALEWVFRESIPVGLTRTAAVADPDGFIHVVCGNTMLPETSYSREQIYIPGEDTWVIGDLQHPAAPGGVHNHDVEIIGNKIWVGGGSRISGNYNNLTVIDLEAHTWTVVGPMPVSNIIYYEFAAGGDGKLYMFGGDGPYNYTYAFDTATRTWSSRASMPVALRDPAAVGIGDTIYLFGGYTDASGTAPTNAVRAYSISGNNWTTKASMPTARGWATANVVFTPDSGPMIYVIGGTNGTNPLNTVERYSVLTGTWTTSTPLQKIRRSHAAVTVGDTTFVVCGWQAARPVPFIRSLERGYDPSLVTAVGQNAEPAQPAIRLTVAPNPCSRQVSVRLQYLIDLQPTLTSLELCDVSGRVIRSFKIMGNGTLSVAGLRSGVYWLRTTTAPSATARLIIQN